MTPFISTLLLKLCRFNLHTFPLIALFIASTIITGCLPSAHTATSDPLPEKVKQQTDTTETITLDGVLYEIPAPWAGHKLEAPTLTYDSFRKIPDAHTK
ncbi:MAG: hypothetical protein KJP19_03800, partial [Deltaproteobacteria bacterium]|nr:hypothetical protein [Deltaproteobacteria bacterium]